MGTASPIAELVTTASAAPALTLRLAASPPRRIEVRGAAAWRAEGPLRYRLIVPARARCAIDVAVREDRATPLPALPAGSLFVAAITNEDHAGFTT